MFSSQETIHSRNVGFSIFWVSEQLNQTSNKLNHIETERATNSTLSVTNIY